jgi:reactive intermediate/imine deaminase
MLHLTLTLAEKEIISMTKQIIQTSAAPAAIGTYSQAVRVDNTLYLSGQIPLIPSTMTLHHGSFREQVIQVIQNLSAVLSAANASLDDIVKLHVYLTDLAYYSEVNTVMAEYLKPPYPARSAVEVSGLPKGVSIEIDAIAIIPT